MPRKPIDKHISTIMEIKFKKKATAFFVGFMIDSSKE